MTFCSHRTGGGRVENINNPEHSCNFMGWRHCGFAKCETINKTTRHQTTRQLNHKTTGLGWKPIPSTARVTRDKVSGI